MTLTVTHFHDKPKADIVKLHTYQNAISGSNFRVAEIRYRPRH